MLCAHTVRRLKPGTFDVFTERFGPRLDDGPPTGWVRFHMLRGLADQNEVVTFGFFDGSFEELERSQEAGDYRARRASIDDLVDRVLADGVYEVVASFTADRART